ncbi:MAG: cadherin-like domain-containing protein, partial [Mariniblastus sp.]
DVLSFTDQNGISGTYNATNGTWTLLGPATLAEYETAIRSITYTNTSDAPDTATRTVSFTVNDGEANSNTQARDIVITAVNDSPVFTGPNTGVVSEDSSLVFSNLGGNAIVLNDVDANGGELAITVQVTNGTIALGGTGNLNGVVGNGTSIVSFSGTVNDINVALDGLSYSGDLNFSGTDTLTFFANDQGNTGSGGAPGTINVAITVDAVNDEEIVSTNTGATIAEGSVSNTITQAMLETTDVDTPPNNLTYQITSMPSEGAVYRNGLALLMGGSFTQSDINLGLVTYTHNGGEATSDSFDFVVDDGMGTTSSGRFNLSVTPVNDAPLLSLDDDGSSGAGSFDFSASFTTGNGPVLIADVDASLNDVDSLALNSISIQITNLLDGVNESLAADLTGLPGLMQAYDSTTGVLEISGAGISRLEFESALRTVTYDNGSAIPDTTTRVIEVVAFDSDDLSSNIARAFVQVSPDTTSPFEVNNFGSTVVEGGTDLIESSELSFADSNRPASSINFIVATPPVNGFLALTSDLSTPISSFTQAQVDAGDVTFVHDGSDTATDTFTFAVDDGVGNAVTMQSFNIIVDPVNDAPTVTLANVVLALAENADTTSTTRVADIVVTDDSDGTNDLTLSGADAASFEIVGSELHLRAGVTLDFESKSSFDVVVEVDDASVGASPDDTVSTALSILDINEAPTVTLTNLVPSLAEDTDTLASIKIADIVISDDALGANDLTLSGADSGLFEIVGAELHLRAGVVLDYESQTSLDVNVQVDDATIGGSPDDFDAHSLMISDENESPLIADDIFTVDENSGNGTVVGNVVFSDVDAGDSISFAITAGDPTGVFSINNAGQILIADGSQLDFETINSFALTVEATDDGSPSLSETATIQINLNDVNEVPTSLLPNNVTISENTNTTGGVSVATLSATDVDAGDWLSFSIVGGADQANFSIGGTNSNELLIDAGTLDYESKQSFEVIVRVTDSGGLVRDEVVTVNVADVNEALSLQINSGINVVEGGSQAITGAELLFTDPEEGPTSIVYQITDESLSGILTIDGVPAGLGSTFSQADIDAGIVVYTHAGSESVADSFGFSVTDGVHVFTGQTFIVSVTPVNDAPAATDDSFVVAEDTMLDSINELLLNDTDSENDALTVSLVSGPTSAASFDLLPDGSFTYSPVENFNGMDQFVYRVTDDSGLSSTAVVTIEVTPVNDVPESVEEQFVVLVGQPLESVASLLSNDTDIDNDALIAVLIQDVSHGSLSLTASGHFVYVPNPGFVGSDSFAYLANDGTDNGALTTVNIEVIGGVGNPNRNNPSGSGADDTGSEESTESEEATEQEVESVAESNEGETVNEDSSAEAENQSSDPASTSLAPVVGVVQTPVPIVNLTQGGQFDDFEFASDSVFDQEHASAVLRLILDSVSPDEVNGNRNEDQLERLRTGGGVVAVFDANYLFQQLSELEQPPSFLTDFNVTVGAVTAFGSLGYVLWSLRGGALLAVALSQLPTWSMIDPLPILESYSRKKEDDETEIGQFFK